MKLNLSLDANLEEPLHTQIFIQIRSLIVSGKIPLGALLPSSRVLAEELCIARNTVIFGYETLIAEGYIESRGTAGTFVSKILPDDLIGVSNDQKKNSTKDNLDPEPVLCFAGSPGGDGASSRPEIDFWVGRSAPDSFPLQIWKKLLVQTLNSSGLYIADYSDPAGLLVLRKAIAEHLARSRGLEVDAEQVIITSGSQDGLNLVYRLLQNNYKKVYVENPCYQGAVFLFQSLGIEVIPIPVDENGMIVDQLPTDHSSIVFVTPSHQFPTGATLSLERRKQILKWAEATDSYIIEDDYDGDFRYDGPPLTSLSGLDNSQRVFYLGTFSKSLGAGLRLGYTVAPKPFNAQARQTKAFMNNGQPWLEQVVLSKFLEMGEFDRHLRRVRKLYKRRRDRLISCIEKHFPETSVSGFDCGLHLVWHIPDDFPTATEIQMKARNKNIGIYSLKSGAAIDLNNSTADNIILLGYSSVPSDDISKAMKILRETINELLPNSSRKKAKRLPRLNNQKHEQHSLHEV